MRMAILAALLVAGCGEGSAFDQGVKDGFRKKGVESCAANARRTAPAGTAVDFEGLCGCVMDKAMAGKSATDLMSYEPGPKDREFIAQCAAERGIKPGG